MQQTGSTPETGRKTQKAASTSCYHHHLTISHLTTVISNILQHVLKTLVFTKINFKHKFSLPNF